MAITAESTDEDRCGCFWCGMLGEGVQHTPGCLVHNPLPEDDELGVGGEGVCNCPARDVARALGTQVDIKAQIETQLRRLCDDTD